MNKDEFSVLEKLLFKELPINPIQPTPFLKVVTRHATKLAQN